MENEEQDGTPMSSDTEQVKFTVEFPSDPQDANICEGCE